MAISEPGDDSVIRVPPEHEKCARHRAYALTCDQFGALLKRADGHCELCGLDREDSVWGLLHIDHDHDVGQWAVRGLLCDACNRRLQRGRQLPRTRPIERYLANAWYRLEMEHLGLPYDCPPEPGLGSTVLTNGRRWMRLSVEDESPWVFTRGATGVTFKSWSALWYDHGPMALKIVDSCNELPNYAPLIHGFALSVLDLAAERRAVDGGI